MLLQIAIDQEYFWYSPGSLERYEDLAWKVDGQKEYECGKLKHERATKEIQNMALDHFF